MANATELFNDFKANWEYWTGAGAFVAALFGYWILTRYYVLPAMRLLWRHCARNEQVPPWAWLRAVTTCLWPLKFARFADQARLWIELRILVPEPVADPVWEYEKDAQRYERIDEDKDFRRRRRAHAQRIRRASAN